MAYTSGELQRNSVSLCSLCFLIVLIFYLLVKHGVWFTGYSISQIKYPLINVPK